MLQRISKFVQCECKRFARFTTAAVAALALGGSFAPAFAQEQGQRSFASAEDAGGALFAAMQAQDNQAPLSILGPAAKEVLSSGDPDEDADSRESFVVKYEEMHRFVKEPNGTVTLVIGAENWPFPITLVNNHGSWFFDTAAGKDEILFRRNWSAIKAGTMVCIGMVLTTSSIAPSTRLSRMRTKKTRRIKLAIHFRLMVIFSGFSRARALMHWAGPRTTSSTER